MNMWLLKPVIFGKYFKIYVAGGGLVAAKFVSPTDKCFKDDCYNDGTCPDHINCICATELDPNWPRYFMQRSCVGRLCDDDRECRDPACSCSNSYERFVDEDAEDEVSFQCVLSEPGNDG